MTKKKTKTELGRERTNDRRGKRTTVPTFRTLRTQVTRLGYACPRKIESVVWVLTRTHLL